MSDRSGNHNVWIADANGGHPRQLSRLDDNRKFTSPTWPADGRSVYVYEYRPDLTSFELWNYSLDRGCAGEQVTHAKASAEKPKDERFGVLGAVASPYGRSLFFAGQYGTFGEDMTLPMWSIYRKDLASGQMDKIVTDPGNAMRPALPPDGRTLVWTRRGYWSSRFARCRRPPRRSTTSMRHDSAIRPRRSCGRGAIPCWARDPVRVGRELPSLQTAQGLAAAHVQCVQAARCTVARLMR